MNFQKEVSPRTEKENVLHVSFTIIAYKIVNQLDSQVIFLLSFKGENIISTNGRNWHSSQVKRIVFRLNISNSNLLIMKIHLKLSRKSELVPWQGFQDFLKIRHHTDERHLDRWPPLLQRYLFKTTPEGKWEFFLLTTNLRRPPRYSVCLRNRFIFIVVALSWIINLIKRNVIPASALKIIYIRENKKRHSIFGR